jgi:hypothetical protein
MENTLRGFSILKKLRFKNMRTKEIPYISVKACPVCGEHPEFSKESLGHPGGGGYPGHYTYQFKCGYCKLLKSGEYHDIYDSPEEAKNRAKKSWNDEVARIEKIMNQAERF